VGPERFWLNSPRHFPGDQDRDPLALWPLVVAVSRVHELLRQRRHSVAGPSNQANHYTLYRDIYRNACVALSLVHELRRQRRHSVAGPSSLSQPLHTVPRYFSERLRCILLLFPGCLATLVRPARGISPGPCFPPVRQQSRARRFLPTSPTASPCLYIHPPPASLLHSANPNANLPGLPHRTGFKSLSSSSIKAD
jgi:hypothetical protein